MKYFYDTEFIEDGRTIDLISIGIVAEDGREFYAVAEEIESDKKLSHRIGYQPWLMANVVPHLPLRKPGGIAKPIENGPARFYLDDTDNRVMPRRMIRNAVREFLLAEDGRPELWAWFGAYDHIVLMQLWGRMLAKPEGIPMYTHDLQQEADRLGVDLEQLVPQPVNAHDALADATWCAVAYRALRAHSMKDVPVPF